MRVISSQDFYSIHNQAINTDGKHGRQQGKGWEGSVNRGWRQRASSINRKEMVKASTAVRPKHFTHTSSPGDSRDRHLWHLWSQIVHGEAPKPGAGSADCKGPLHSINAEAKPTANTDSYPHWRCFGDLI